MADTSEENHERVLEKKKKKVATQVTKQGYKEAKEARAPQSGARSRRWWL